MPYFSSLISAQGLLGSSRQWSTLACTPLPQDAQPPASPSEGSDAAPAWLAWQEEAVGTCTS